MTSFTFTGYNVLMKKKPGLPWNIPTHSLLFFLFFALIFALQVVPRLWTDSPAGDEVVDMGDGYYYWKGDVISDAHHPPLAKALQALPIRAMGVESKAKGLFSSFERRDYNFLFILNRNRFENITAWARGVTLLFGLGVGLLLFLAARGLSREVTLFTMIFWAFEPNLMAYSSLVMADVPLSFFLLAAVMSYEELKIPSSWKGGVRTGLLAGMAVVTKFSAVILMPVYFLLEVLRFRARKDKDWVRERGSLWSWGLLSALLWISLVYLPGTLKIPDCRWPLSYFWEGFSTTVAYSGHPTYFLGELSPTNHWAYYPVAFLLKSPIPFLVFLFLAAWLGLTRRLRVPAWQWLTPLLLFAAVLHFLNLGIRQVLPIYPFLILIAAQGAAWLWSQGGRQRNFLFRALVIALLAFQAISVASCFPSQISYLNELVTSEKRLYWLGDSNLDLGLDAKRLAETAKRRGWSRIKLAYFGETDPSLYGMKWQPWTQKDLAGPQPGWVYAINVGFLQLGPAYFPDAAAINRGWITQSQPTGMVGSTWYFYEIPGEAPPDTSPHLVSAPPFKYFDGLNQ